MKVRLIAKTELNPIEVDSWLRDLGVSKKARETLDTGHNEKLLELAGRRCYKSFEPGLNANVTKVRDDPEVYMENILKSGHGSVLEHCSMTFAIEGVSRVLTHELVRHRAGTAISQESMRYVRLEELDYYIPPELDGEPYIKEQVASAFSFIESTLRKIHRAAEIEDKPFHVKKAITSATRRLVPQGVSTGLVWTANLRALRMIIEQRTSLAAEVEIRELFDIIAGICKKEFPLVFQDYERNSDGEWKPKYSKV